MNDGMRNEEPAFDARLYGPKKFSRFLANPVIAAEVQMRRRGLIVEVRRL